MGIHHGAAGGILLLAIQTTHQRGGVGHGGLAYGAVDFRMAPDHDIQHITRADAVFIGLQAGGQTRIGARQHFRPVLCCQQGRGDREDLDMLVDIEGSRIVGLCDLLAGSLELYARDGTACQGDSQGQQGSRDQTWGHGNHRGYG